MFHSLSLFNMLLYVWGRTGLCASQAESPLCPMRPSAPLYMLRLACRPHGLIHRTLNTKHKSTAKVGKEDYLAGVVDYLHGLHHTHTKVEVLTYKLNWTQMCKHSQAVFAPSAHPLVPLRPPTPNLHPSRPCIPSIVGTGATGHATYWIQLHAGHHAGPLSLSAGSTCIVCKTDLDFDLHSAPSSCLWAAGTRAMRTFRVSLNQKTELEKLSNLDVVV